MLVGLNKTATILRATYSQNEYGEPVESWREIATVPCRLQAIAFGHRAELQAMGAAHHTIASHRLFVPVTAIAPNDRVIIDNTTYIVLEAEDVDRMGHHMECHIARVEGVT